MNQLRSLAKGRNLRGYSKLRKADLINFLRENEPSPNSSRDEIEQPQIENTNKLSEALGVARPPEESQSDPGVPEGGLN